MNIEKYGFERSDLVVVTAVNAYLKKLTPEARRKTLSEIVKQDGVIDGLALAALIENAKAAAMISSEEWQPGEGDYQRALSFIQEQLPVVDGKKYVKKIRQVCNDIFVNAFRSFDLEDTDPEKGQMSGIQELFEVGDVLIGIHVVIDICALLHDLSVFINEKSFYRDIEFLEMVRKIFLIGRKQAA